MTSGSRIPSGRRVYAIGDIHGRADLLRALLRKIETDAAARPGPSNLIVYLGDYVDRGPGSHEVLDLIAEAPRGFELRRLLGNHEALMRDVLDGNTDSFRMWLDNGGDATLRSYGIAPEDIVRSGAAARAKVPSAHRALLDALDLSYVEGDYFFVHAGVRPGISLDAQDRQDLIWIRGAFLNSDEDFGKIVVHGHSVVPEADFKRNRIAVDTGAYRSGILSAVVLEDTDRRVIKT